jgi:hypothetical protein
MLGPSRDPSVLCSLCTASLKGIMIDFSISLPGFSVRIIQTERSVAYQQMLYASGRTQPGPWLTNCDGVTTLSNHQQQIKHGENACHAFDIGVFKADGTYLSEATYYEPLATIAPNHGMVSGWSFSRQDPDHVECNPDLAAPATVTA